MILNDVNGNIKLLKTAIDILIIMVMYFRVIQFYETIFKQRCLNFKIYKCIIRWHG